MTLPLWARALLALDRQLRRALNLEAGLRDELLLNALGAEERDAVTIALHDDANSHFLPGSAFFAEGLFEWERRALATPPFPQSGHVLVGAAGGGREVRALLDRGYRVTAFEPSASLWAAAAAAHPAATVLRGTYGDLDGALRSLAAQEFDGVIMGWGSLSHLTTAPQREAAVRALRRLAPRAPLVASYLDLDGITPSPRVDWARVRLRRLLRAFGAHQPVEGRELFIQGSGFCVPLAHAEVAQLMCDCGYRIAHAEPSFVLCAP
jgi:hypothetical protein